MDEIVTKSNLDSFTQGLKGVLGSMGLEINSKAGNTAVSAVGAKVDTVDGKCDLILTAVGSGSGDVDYSQFVTKEYLEYALIPHFHFNVRNFYYKYYTYPSTILGGYIKLKNSESVPKLTYFGLTLGNQDGDNKIICNRNHLSDNTNNNNPSSLTLTLDENYNAALPIGSYNYFGLNIATGSSNKYQYCVSASNLYYGTIPTRSVINVSSLPAALHIGFRKLVVIKKDGEEVNDVYVILDKTKCKSRDYIYTKKSIPETSFYKIKVPDIDGYNCIVSDMYNYIIILYYPILSIYQDTANFSTEIGLCYGNYSEQNSEISIPIAFSEIMKNTHLYCGTYTNGEMLLKQVDDNDYTLYVDGTSVNQNASTHMVIKFPEFYAKFSSSSQIEFYIDLTSLTQPSGEGWHKYGDSLIGAYCSSTSSYTSTSYSYNAAVPSIWEALNQNNSDFCAIGLKEFAILRIISKSLNNVKFLDGTGRKYAAFLDNDQMGTRIHFISDLYVTLSGLYLDYGGALSGHFCSTMPTTTNKYGRGSSKADGYGNLTRSSVYWNSSSSYRDITYEDGATIPSKLYLLLPLTQDMSSQCRGTLGYSSGASYAYEKYTGPYTIID